MNNENNKCKYCGQELDTSTMVMKCKNLDCPSNKETGDKDNKPNLSGGQGGAIIYALEVCDFCQKQTEWPGDKPKPEHDCWEEHKKHTNDPCCFVRSIICNDEFNFENCPKCDKHYTEPGRTKKHLTWSDCREWHKTYQSIKSKIRQQSSSSNKNQSSNTKGANHSIGGSMMNNPQGDPDKKTNWLLIGGVIILALGVGGIAWYMFKKNN